MIRVHIDNTGIPQQNIDEYMVRAEQALKSLKEDTQGLTGWIDLPQQYDRTELEQIKTVAGEIQEKCDLFIVIGIGGSYLGAKAAIEALAPSGGYPEVRFAGINLDAAYHIDLLKKMEQRRTCVCCISKSGGTMETTVAFNLFRDAMIEKYGKEEATKRIYVITDAEHGVLREEVNSEGYTSFEVPRNIGGRYSVLTAVGLLPVAVAGIDVQAMLDGAAAQMEEDMHQENAMKYAVARYFLIQSDKSLELFHHYVPSMFYFVEWVKQLFGESEGKNGMGLFPIGFTMTTDMHSIGQFLQQGKQMFFETVLDIQRYAEDLEIKSGALAGKTMNQMNHAATKSVIKAHREVGIPIIKIDIPELTPYYYGQLIYLFETVCAITATLMGVDPFDQPGVEAYKTEMRKELGI